jgi:hypothetical protein
VAFLELDRERHGPGAFRAGRRLVALPRPAFSPYTLASGYFFQKYGNLY